MFSLLLASLALASAGARSVLAAPARSAGTSPRSARGLFSPTVTLDEGTFTGLTDGTVHSFLGIPFAQPPTGNLRFRLPVANAPYSGDYDAGTWGAACPQQDEHIPIPAGLGGIAVNYIEKTVFAQKVLFDEDCLHLNVITPASAQPGDNLPVVVWIFGGGFETGATLIYDGGLIVDRSIDLGMPVVYVSMEYRLSAFGFLGGQEVKDAGVGNLGLQDQRQALRWVQKYITQFGGDPTKVTLWGESAGAMSIGLHMVANNGNIEGLFRAAFMESGGTVPIGDITKAQGIYDAIVDETGCTGAQDTLDCLRQVPYDDLLAANNKAPGLFDYPSLKIPFLPRADGTYVTNDPMSLAQSGTMPNIPFVIGDVDDEGTLFAIGLLNITTDDDFRAYMHDNYMPTASDDEVDQLATLYPDDITQGSPFNTGVLNALSPQFKRLAAVQGDLVFQMPRRVLLKAPLWSTEDVDIPLDVSVSKRLKIIPGMGSMHGTDLLNVYAEGDMADYLIRFATNLDPNVGGGQGINWPQYDTTNKQMLLFQDGLTQLTVIQDTFREAPMEYLEQLANKYPV